MNIEYNMRGILHALFRQKWKFILVFFGFFLAGLFIAMSVQPIYEARGSILVKFGQGAKPDINMPGNQRPNELSQNNRHEIIESNIKILKSHTLLRDVINTIGNETLYPKTEPDKMSTNTVPKTLRDEQVAIQKAVNQLLDDDLNVKTSGDSNLIEIFIKNKDPDVAALFADKLIATFMIRQAEIYNTAQTSFLEKQIVEMEQQLKQSRDNFFSFKKNVGISAIDEEMRQLLGEKSELSSLAFQSVAKAQSTLAALEAKIAEMQSTYSSQSPIIKRLRESIELAEGQLRDRQSSLNTISNENSLLSVKISLIDERITWLEGQRGQYNELEQRVQMNEENYRYYQQRGEAARINNLLNAQNITRISIVDRPIASLYPIPSRKKLIVLAFLMAGMCLGLGIALILELLDDRLTSPERVTSSLELPVLETFRE